MTTKKFAGHEQAAAKIRYYGNGRIELVSYATTVAVIDESGWLVVNGLYSMTTIKHIGWFMKMFNLSYSTAKALYTDNMTMNVHTGEVIARA